MQGYAGPGKTRTIPTRQSNKIEAIVRVIGRLILYQQMLGEHTESMSLRKEYERAVQRVRRGSLTPFYAIIIVMSGKLASHAIFPFARSSNECPMFVPSSNALKDAKHQNSTLFECQIVHP